MYVCVQTKMRQRTNQNQNPMFQVYQHTGQKRKKSPKPHFSGLPTHWPKAREDTLWKEVSIFDDRDNRQLVLAQRGHLHSTSQNKLRAIDCQLVFAEGLRILQDATEIVMIAVT